VPADDALPEPADAGGVPRSVCRALRDPGRAMSEVPRRVRPVLDRVVTGIRRWDLKGHPYVANSRHTRRRINEIYGRRADIVHPPVEVERLRPGEPDDYFLAVSGLVPHKRIEVAAEAASDAGQRRKVVGAGPRARAPAGAVHAPCRMPRRCGDHRLGTCRRPPADRHPPPGKARRARRRPSGPADPQAGRVGSGRSGRSPDHRPRRRGCPAATRGADRDLPTALGCGGTTRRAARARASLTVCEMSGPRYAPARCASSR
jgi:hypothetical protein